MGTSQLVKPSTWIPSLQFAEPEQPSGVSCFYLRASVLPRPAEAEMEATAPHPRALLGPEGAAGPGRWSWGSQSGSPPSAQPGLETDLQAGKEPVALQHFTQARVCSRFSH